MNLDRCFYGTISKDIPGILMVAERFKPALNFAPHCAKTNITKPIYTTKSMG